VVLAAVVVELGGSDTDRNSVQSANNVMLYDNDFGPNYFSTYDADDHDMLTLSHIIGKRTLPDLLGSTLSA
jgi:hypothetical protein